MSGEFLIWAGVACFMMAAWMTYDFVGVYRENGGWPWAGEVPVMIILLMVAFGAFLIALGPSVFR